MRRRLLNLLTAGSLLLCVAAVVLWVRSYWVSHFLGVTVIRPTGADTTLTLSSSNGEVSYYHQCIVYAPREDAEPRVTWGYGSATPSTYDGPERWAQASVKVAGFAVMVLDSKYPAGFGQHGERGIAIRAVAVPWWMIVAVSGGLAVPLARRLRRRHRLGYSGTVRCSHCGYDLRATPDRCPECGAAAGTAGAA